MATDTQISFSANAPSSLRWNYVAIFSTDPMPAGNFSASNGTFAGTGALKMSVNSLGSNADLTAFLTNISIGSNITFIDSIGRASIYEITGITNTADHVGFAVTVVSVNSGSFLANTIYSVSFPSSGGGGSFNPHSPGPIGDTTPGTGAFTSVIFNVIGDFVDATGAGSVAANSIAWDAIGNMSFAGASLSASGNLTLLGFLSVGDGEAQILADGSFSLTGLSSNSAGLMTAGNNIVWSTNSIGPVIQDQLSGQYMIISTNGILSAVPA